MEYRVAAMLYNGSALMRCREMHQNGCVLLWLAVRVHLSVCPNKMVAISQAVIANQ
jgi:hypothetical protein